VDFKKPNQIWKGFLHISKIGYKGNIVSMTKKVPKKYFLLIGIFLVGLGLRWLQLSGNLYADEVWIIKTAVSPFPDFVQELKEDWVHPPLFHFLVRGWVYFFGLSDLSGRLVALTFGVLSILLIFWLGEWISGVRTGLVAAGLLALSPIHIYYSQYGRHYSLFVFFVLLSMAAFLKVYYQLDNRRYGIFYIFSSILLVYTHYFGWLIVFCQGFFFLFRRFNYFRHWVVLQAIVILSYIPWIFLVAKFASETVSNQQLVPHISWMERPSLWEPVRTLIWFNGLLPIPHQGVLSFLLLGGISLLSLKGIFRKDKYREAILFLFSCVVVPFVLVFVVSRTVQPIWILRAMLVSLPAYYLLIALGSQQIGEKASFGLMFIPIIWMSLVCLSYLRNEHRMPYEQIASYLESESEDGIPILVENTYLMNPLFFYYKGKGFLYELWESNISVVSDSNKGSLSQIEKGGDRLILVTYTPSGQREIQSKLSSTYRVAKRKEFFGYGEDLPGQQLRKVSIFFYEKN
jgi:uncharacterized membrane protein